MDLNNDYDKLYNHWLKEFQQSDLTPLSQEEFDDYIKNLKEIQSIEVNDDDKLKAELLKSYKNNFEFIFNDFLKIREIKILNAALTLQEIELANIIEVEKLFFQNMVASIKGYEKIKKLSLYSDTKDNMIKPINSKPIKEEFLDLSIDNKVKENISEEQEHANELIIKHDEKKNFNYIMIRFLKKTPPLVGIDLLNYGPFEKEDIASLPFKNAKILISENFAKLIELE